MSNIAVHAQFSLSQGIFVVNVSMSKNFFWVSLSIVAVLVTIALINPSGIDSKSLLFLVLATALIDSLNPCAFSVLLLTIAFLFSLGKTREVAVKVGGTYIFGIFISYLLIGLGILQALQFFGIPHFMAKITASLLVVLGGLGIVGELIPSFPIKLKIPAASHGVMARLMEKRSIPTAFILGAFVGLCEFPCTGGPYLLILGLLHDHTTYFSGIWHLVIYNVIFVLPLVLILLAASNERVLQKVQEWRKDNIKKFRLWGGIAAVILGILIFVL